MKPNLYIRAKVGELPALLTLALEHQTSALSLLSETDAPGVEEARALVARGRDVVLRLRDGVDSVAVLDGGRS